MIDESKYREIQSCWKLRWWKFDGGKERNEENHNDWKGTEDFHVCSVDFSRSPPPFSSPRTPLSLCSRSSPLPPRRSPYGKSKVVINQQVSSFLGSRFSDCQRPVCPNLISSIPWKDILARVSANVTGKNGQLIANNGIHRGRSSPFPST